MNHAHHRFSDVKPLSPSHTITTQGESDGANPPMAHPPPPTGVAGSGLPLADHQDPCPLGGSVPGDRAKAPGTSHWAPAAEAV